ncbi:unnamed protein product, partial [Haemonchus placei]|uniref:Restriction endonuclease subunit S n=1 Tax=Haemonchus placei TaxID=6290 RepID=A0A0N4WWC6_HAEPC
IIIQKASASQVIGHAIDDEYLKAYYEQYYNEWYSSEQLNKICADIKKATQDYGIRNPKSFALENCPLIQMYYKNIIRETIQHYFDLQRKFKGRGLRNQKLVTNF